MSESVNRTNPPTGQSLPISQEKMPRRHLLPPRKRKARKDDDQVDPPAPQAQPTGKEPDDTGHVDCLV